MDPEQTFLRVHARLSGMLARLLTPRFRAVLEYLCLFNAVVLLALLVIMHVNFVAQPGCSKEFSGVAVADAQLVQIKITGSWNRIAEDDLIDQSRFRGAIKNTDVEEFSAEDAVKNHQKPPGHPVRDVGAERWNLLAAKFWLNLVSNSWRRREALKFEVPPDSANYARAPEQGTKNALNSDSSSDGVFPPYMSPRPLAGPGRGPLGRALLHYLTRWSSYVAVFLKRVEQSLRSFWQIWRVTGWEPVTASSKGDRRGVAWNKLDPVLVDLADNRRKMLDPTYLYSVEKGYLMLSEAAKLYHGIKTVNVTVSAQDVCFGNRWQQLLIDNFVGYDTILMNSLLHARGKGYLYNFQTKELYNLNYLQEFNLGPHGFEDYIVVKCGVLITSLFVFFTTTMSVSFTLRETQARMLKFTVQLQHHARHQLPTFRLIFVHVVESLIFVPIMIGILFFLFEFFDDQLLAFMVLTLVWLCELYTMISVRTPLSMQYFPRFFFLYFMVFHVYFFSYTYGFSYLAFSATGAFMQHLVLYFWNQFEVPALQNFLQRRAMFQQQGLHISSAILQVARLTNGSLLGEGRNGVSLNPIGQRPGSPFAGARNPETGGASEGRDGRVPRTSQASPVYPFSINNLRSFSMNGNGGIFNSSIGPSGGVSGFVSQSSPNSVPGDSENWTRRAGGGAADGQSVPQGSGGGTDTVGSSVGNSAPSEEHPADSSAGDPGPPSGGGPLSALGSLVPWILGAGPGAVISFLPIFRDFRDERHDGAADAEQEQEESVLRRGVMGGHGETRLRRRSTSLPPSRAR